MLTINNSYLNNRYNLNLFVNNPNKVSDIEIIYNKKINKNIDNVYISIVIPIHNQEYIIRDNIISILECTTEYNYEIIIILDSCDDKTENIILELLTNTDNLIKYGLLQNIIILKSNIPLFETAADNLGFICSSGKYILEIQADMKMTEIGYNTKIIKPFLKDENIIGISGRCCHNFKWQDKTKGKGKLGNLVEKNIEDISNILSNKYYIYETCNRGPLLLDKTKLEQLKYLDEKNYFLDNSEHDLFARAYSQFKYTCGYVPINYYSPLDNGSTRKPKNTINNEYYSFLKKYTNNSNNGFLKEYLNSFKDERKILEYDL
jgi:hypothetical protein